MSSLILIFLPLLFLLLFFLFLFFVPENSGVSGRIGLLGSNQRSLVRERAEPAEQLPVSVLRLLLQKLKDFKEISLSKKLIVKTT